MTFSKLCSLLAIVFGCLLIPADAIAQRASTTELTTLEIGSRMPEFELTGFRGRDWSSNEFSDKQAFVVIFMGTECPLVKLYASRLNEISDRFKDNSVQLVGINSNLQDSMAEIGAFARDTNVEFPLLKDPGNRVADAFGAARTPEAFVFDADRRLVYHGCIDDQYTYGRQRPEVGNEYVVAAIENIVSGTELEVATTEVVGCHIGRSTRVNADSDSEITYARHISRILQEKCVSCHRPGEIGPFSLTDYDEVSGWADMIREVINEKRMPPWHANPEHGTFMNDIRLSDQEIELINRWVDEGVAEGDAADLPEPLQFTDGWQIGEPDEVISMEKSFQVPATGIVDYKYFYADKVFEEDKYVEAAEIRIGNRAVVHHVILFLEGDDGEFHGGGNSEWITATAPGSPPTQFAEGYAKLIPAGTRLVFQMHYTPNGTAQEDITSVGFKFADPEDVQKVVSTRQIIYTDLQIPPNEDDYRVTETGTLRQDTEILALFPHMHLRGKSFTYTAKCPRRMNREDEILLDVPGYDFNWQNSYIFDEPLILPAGTTIECVAHFDNSRNNIANPAPDEWVYWGDQTDEEMMIGYFDMAPADPNNSRTQTLLRQLEDENYEAISPELRQQIRRAPESRTQMRRLGAQMRRTFPQIDRCCWTMVQDGELTVTRVAQVAAFNEALGGEGTSAPADQCRLTEIIESGGPMVMTDLKAIESPDIQFMSSVARSSFHYPLEIDGIKGSLNFWSSEPDAFPEPVVKLLSDLCGELER
ncbi:MAG: redoxin domain-containing protein [Planctomycetota bacterium]